MVKRQTVRQKISRKEAKKQAGKDEEIIPNANNEIEPGSSRMKRKLSKKLQFLSKLQETQSILATKKKISKKRHRSKKSVLNNLSSIAEVLPEIKEKTEKQFHLPKGSQAKARQKLVITEVKQLSMVLDHPRFKQNPFAAIHEHLKVSLDPVKEDPLKPLKDKRAEKQNKQRRRLAPVKMEE